MNFTSILLLISVLLLISLSITMQILFKVVKNNKDLKNEIEKSNRINEKKAQINTGNNWDDFTSTIELLQKFSKNKR